MTSQSHESPNRDNFRTVSGFLLGSPETKSHSDVGAAERCKEYYTGEGGGFPQVQAVVSHVSPELPMACFSTKGATECRNPTLKEL